MIPYIAPYWSITIGNYKVEKMVSFDVFSARKSPTDHAEIKLPLEGLDLNSIKKDDQVIIHQGYREQGLWRIFKGTVDNIEPDKESVMVFASDQMKKLKKKISKAFIQVSPQEIIKYGLMAAGVDNYILGSSSFPPLPGFTAANESVISLFKRINKSWKALEDWDFYFEPEDIFYWGPWEESPRYRQNSWPKLQYGINIISHNLISDTKGIIEIPVLPYLRHSHRIKIQDPRYWPGEKEVRIERVKYHHSTKARMELEWEHIAS